MSPAQTTATVGDEVAAAEQAPEPLSAEEMEILVARVALYPDELIAVITAASLYPVQIIEAQRFLDDSKTDKTLQPKSTWDGSVVSLLNYPEIIKMMSDDLDWTQLLGEAIINQQQDVLAAIQQLRERAVAEGIIKTDDKVKIVEEGDNIIIQPASTEVIYVPQYPPEMLYEPDYIYRPITYYPDPYPYYYSPVAPYFAGVVTGVIWAGVVDWDDGFWGGNWGNDWGNDIDIDCNNCIIDGDFNGKLDINNVDWKKVDRNKISFNKNELNKIDRSKVKTNIKNNDRNKITNKGGDLKANRPETLPGKGNRPTKDVRSSTLEGLKKQPATKPVAKPSTKPGQGVSGKPASKPSKPSSGSIDRPVGKPKPAVKPDNRPKNPSPVGEVKRGVDTKKESNRGAKSMGGGYKAPSGGGGQGMKKRPMPHGGGGGGRGGGGRGRR
ncbi:MAG: DUF3300 domain-containing protein [Alphaproteobacteria bacterium]|nr:DUF3300 domain-containing protein [Alphaproteobacteria bacterium]